MSVQGKGNVKLHLTGVTYVIIDVSYALESNNLISVGQLQEKKKQF